MAKNAQAVEDADTSSIATSVIPASAGFMKYPKIHALGSEENQNIFSNPDDLIHIEEKVDGANFRFMWSKDGRIIFGSRTQSLGDDGQDIGGNWKRCVTWVKDKLAGRKGVHSLVFFGECMVQHSIAYDWDRVPPFLGFDVMDLTTGQFLDYQKKVEVFNELGLDMVPLLEILKVDDLVKKYPKFDDGIVPQSKFYSGPAEGMVFKNYKEQVFGKYVTDKFKEVNRDVFGGSKKFAENDDERIVAMFCPNSRIDKIIFKMVDEGAKLEMAMMSELPRRIMQDIMDEHSSEICMSTWSVNFRNVRKKVTHRAVSVLKQIIANNALNQGGKK